MSSAPHLKTTSPTRSEVVGVNVVSNKAGWHINRFHNGSPAASYGPFPEPVSLSEALTYVAAIIKLE